MTYTLDVIELDRENRPNDLVKLLGGQKNCFHIRRHPEGTLKKLKPLQAVIVDPNQKIIGNAPENVILELHSNRMDIGDMVEVKLEYKDMGGQWYPYEDYMGKHMPEFYLNRIRPRFNEDGSVMCNVTPVKLRVRFKRS